MRMVHEPAIMKNDIYMTVSIGPSLAILQPIAGHSPDIRLWAGALIGIIMINITI